MSPGRIEDPEGAKTVVVIFNTAAGAAASIIERRFLITCYTEADRGRLRLDAALTTSDILGARKRVEKNLIYDNIMHPLSSLDPINCGQGITPRERLTWATNTLKILEQLSSIILPEETAYIEDDMDIVE